MPAGLVHPNTNDTHYQRIAQEQTTMHQRKLGASGSQISALGLGCMGMSEFYGQSDDAASLQTLG